MIIKECDKRISDSNEKLIEMGLADSVVHSLIFDRYLTEEEMEENRAQAELLTREQWSNRCDDMSYNLYNQLYPIMDLINEKYVLYQYPKNNRSMEYYSTDWDLFFYSNRKWNGREYYDYCTLSPNSKRTVGENKKLIEGLLEFLRDIEAKNISCRVQYSVKKHEQDIKALSDTICEKLLDKFIDYLGMSGKIKIVDEVDGIKHYGFFKKGTRNRYYTIDEGSLVSQQARNMAIK